VSLNESLNVVSTVKEIVAEPLYVIPDFPAHNPGNNRKIDPNVTLFANKQGNSFAINTVSGRPHSIDVWIGTDPVPKTIKVDKDIKQLLGDVAEEIVESLLQESRPSPEDYEYSDPETIFDDLSIYIDMVIDGEQPALLLTGTSGSGKSKTIEDRLAAANKVEDRDFVIIKGKSTPGAVYVGLYENNGKLVIFDDCDSVLKSDDAVSVLMGALDSKDVRKISWKSKTPIKNEEGKIIPQSFDFKGQVIFVSNIPMKNMPDALKTRAFNLEVAISPSDMLKLLTNKMKDIMPKESMGTKKVALHTIKRVAEKNADVQINFRTFIKAVKILKKVQNDFTVAQRLIVQQCSYK
jgi:cellulose synthase/poly-beta-1,6-N-acetylglucosamine synthase-like glycosyltransferase